MTKFAPAIFFAAFVAWCVWFVPPNMDEFSPFLRLACSYPHAHLNTFREGCHLYELDFGWFSYHRSYAYIGITPAAMYFPFWALWNSPGSFYLLGILSLVLFSVGLTRALRLPRRFAVIPLCYFPIAYLAIHDSGPIRLSLLSIPALVLLSEIAIRRRTRLQSLLAGAAAGAIMVVCAEEKIFFLLIVPLVVLCGRLRLA